MLLDGDSNFDGAVNGIDFSLFASNFGLTNKKWSQGDFNLDGNVDGIDFSLLASNFGQAVPGSPVPAGATPADWAALETFAGTTAVPEPSALCLVGLGMAGLIGRRRRR